MILKWILKKYGVRMRNAFIWIKIRTTASSCEHDNESSFSTGGRGGFLDELSDC
jgi:hypothetical protein